MKIKSYLMVVLLFTGMSPRAYAFAFSGFLAPSRYYDTAQGRFISADPIVQGPQDPQTLNRYAYVQNNPLNKVDPDGHWAILVPIIVGAAMGGTGGRPFDSRSWSNFNWRNASIGGLAGAAGYGAGTWAFTAVGGGLGGMMAGGIAGGFSGGAAGAGLSTRGNMLEGAMLGGITGAMSGAFTAGLGHFGVNGALGSAGGAWLGVYTMNGFNSRGASLAMRQSFHAGLLTAGLNAYTPIGKSGRNADRFSEPTNSDTMMVTTPQFHSPDDVLFNVIALLVGNGYSHTAHTGDIGKSYTPKQGWYKEIATGVPHQQFDGIPKDRGYYGNINSLVTDNCTTRFGYTHPGQIDAHFSYSYPWHSYQE